VAAVPIASQTRIKKKKTPGFVLGESKFRISILGKAILTEVCDDLPYFLQTDSKKTDYENRFYRVLTMMYNTQN
jgi:hypothetical protein